ACDLLHVDRLDLELVPAHHRHVRPAAVLAAEDGEIDLPLALAPPAAEPRRDEVLLERRALANRVARDDVEVEVEAVRHHLPRRPDAHVNGGAAPPGGVLPPRVHDCAGERELVHAPSSTVFSTRSTARSTAPLTSSLRPRPISSPTAGSHATTTTLPG